MKAKKVYEFIQNKSLKQSIDNIGVKYKNIKELYNWLKKQEFDYPIDIDYEDNMIYVDGDLNLNDITELPFGFFNIEINGYLDLGHIKEINGHFAPKVFGALFLTTLKELNGKFEPTVQEEIDLPTIEKINGEFKPICYNLNLNSLLYLPKIFNPEIHGYLNLYSLKELSDNFNLEIGEYLSLDKLEKLPDNFSPKIGGYLSLPQVKKIPVGFKPKVDNFLNLDSVIYIEEGASPIVKRSVGLHSLPSNKLPYSFIKNIGGKIHCSDGIINNYK